MFFSEADFAISFNYGLLDLKTLFAWSAQVNHILGIDYKIVVI